MLPRCCLIWEILYIAVVGCNGGHLFVLNQIPTRWGSNNQLNQSFIAFVEHVMLLSFGISAQIQ